MSQAKPNLPFPVESGTSIEHAPTDEDDAVRFMQCLAVIFIALSRCIIGPRGSFGTSVVLPTCVPVQLFKH
jgi:hypothetical protein